MFTNLKKKSEGFTIIEVLIVLAIAGLILLIVFLAVPALQRNSRNTQRRNDVAGYLGAVSEWGSNNNGKVPATTADTAAINSLANTGLLTEPTAAPLTGNQSGAVSINDLQLVVKARCDGTTGNTVGGSTRQIAVRFAVEGSNGSAIPQCQES